MKKLILLTLVTIIISSCEKHHDQEQVVKELIASDGDLNGLMEGHTSTKYYKDSVLKTTNPDTLWLEYFAKFKDNYTIDQKGIWLDKWYYYNYEDTDNAQVSQITIRSSKDPLEVLEFHFKNKDDKWQLIGINYNTVHSFNE